MTNRDMFEKFYNDTKEVVDSGRVANLGGVWKIYKDCEYDCYVSIKSDVKDGDYVTPYNTVAEALINFVVSIRKIDITKRSFKYRVAGWFKRLHPSYKEFRVDKTFLDFLEMKKKQENFRKCYS